MGEEPQPKARVASRSRLEEEVFDTALEKLWIHGGAQVDAEDNIARGPATWQASYVAQREHRVAQLTDMLRFAECGQCRMVALVRHFGDWTASGERCGICDFCAPAGCVAQRFLPPSEGQLEQAHQVLAALRSAGALSTGRLFTQLSGGTGDRRDFEHLITGLARAGLIELEEASFEKDGKRIDFRRARPTARATALNPGAPLDLALTGQIVRSAALTKPKGKRRRAKAGAAELPAPSPPARRTRKRSPDAGGLEEALRNWRRDEARRQNVPAFRILSDRTLKELAEEIPTSESSLLAVHGIGKSKADKYGKQLLQILRTGSHTPRP